MSEWMNTFEPTYTIGTRTTTKAIIAIVYHFESKAPIYLGSRDVTEHLLSENWTR